MHFPSFVLLICCFHLFSFIKGGKKTIRLYRIYSEVVLLTIFLSVWIAGLWAGLSWVWKSSYGSPYPWKWDGNGNMISPCGDPHMDIHMGISIWRSTYGSPWGFPQKSCGYGMGVGMEIPSPRQPWLLGHAMGHWVIQWVI